LLKSLWSRKIPQIKAKHLMVKVSLISTVYNEAESIVALLDSLYRQTRRPDEIIIVDGGSRDATPELIGEWAEKHPDLPLTLRVEPGANISRGRNRAIETASFPVIAATDAGVRLPPNWLEKLIEPYERENTPPDAVICGFFRADPAPGAVFEIAMGATVLPVERDIRPDKFLPSSRSVAFSKRAWVRTGGYPEWLDYCEDLIFDFNLKKEGYPFIWQPSAVALFKPRRNLKSFFVQYYRYARGDGKADLFLKRHILRYFIYLLFVPLGVLLARRFSLIWFLLLICGEGYVARAHRRLITGEVQGWRDLTILQKLLALALVPIIRSTGDMAKMAGYPPGVWWRLKQRR
jgi:glycosyltransferase involved in cell wall biosynthesis